MNNENSKIATRVYEAMPRLIFGAVLFALVLTGCVSVAEGQGTVLTLKLEENNFSIRVPGRLSSRVPNSYEENEISYDDPRFDEKYRIIEVLSSSWDFGEGMWSAPDGSLDVSVHFVKVPREFKGDIRDLDQLKNLEFSLMSKEGWRVPEFSGITQINGRDWVGYSSQTEYNESTIHLTALNSSFYILFEAVFTERNKNGDPSWRKEAISKYSQIVASMIIK